MPLIPEQRWFPADEASGLVTATQLFVVEKFVVDSSMKPFLAGQTSQKTQCNVQPKLLPVDFRLPLAAIFIAVTAKCKIAASHLERTRWLP